jgi:hypothetical protein
MIPAATTPPARPEARWELPLAVLDVEAVEDWNRAWALEVLAARAAVLGRPARVKVLAGIILSLFS